MLATLGGVLALVAGLIVLLLPVVATELSRPRDSAWGAVVLLLGLVLVTSAERLMGAPMLGVLCGGLLIGRLGLEVGQSRWRALTPEEQQRLWSQERWRTSLGELAASLGRLVELAAGATATALGWLQQGRQPRTTTKRWVRQDPAIAPASEGPAPAAPAPPTVVVTSLEGVDALLESGQLRPEQADQPAQESASTGAGEPDGSSAGTASPTSADAGETG